MDYIQKLKNLNINISILYIENDDAIGKILTSYLKKYFYEITYIKDAIIGLQTYKKRAYDIVITGILMPHLNGLEMIKEIKRINPHQEILLTTAFSQTQYLIEAISLNVSGYIIKPINYDALNEILYKIIEKIKIFREHKRYDKYLKEVVQERTAVNLKLKNEKIKNYERTLVSLVELVEKRDTYTGGHSLRVAHYCKLIAQSMKYSQKECDLLYRAGVLHDIGKIETPDAVLLKPGKLDDLEYHLIKQHVTTGAVLLANIPMYHELSNIMASHHERYDGKGYPKGLKKDEIPKLSRIMIIADAFDAMTTNRIYKPRMSLQDAIKQMKKFSGSQFDPKVISFAIEVLKNIKIDTHIFQLPSSQMEEKRFAFFFEDSNTKCYNHTYLDLILIQNQIEIKEKYLSVFFIHNFRTYNLKYSWGQGDQFLKEVVKILRVHYSNAQIFRLHGDDFVIINTINQKINLSMFDELLKRCDNLIWIATKSFNIHQQKIKSLLKLEKLINK